MLTNAYTSGTTNAAANNWPKVIGMPVSPLNLDECIEQILSWGALKESRYVCVANVHMAVESELNAKFREVVASADLVTSDGMPLVWLLKTLGYRKKERVCGRDIMKRTFEQAQERKLAIGFFGGQEESLRALIERTAATYPTLDIAFHESPPFRELTPEEDEDCIERINTSGIGILFVGLGCPKQEFWMAAHAGRVNAVMIGVGAAFDFLSGQKKNAPHVLQKLGLEWLYRLYQEPRRLWRRYLYTNTYFIFLLLLNLIRTRT